MADPFLAEIRIMSFNFPPVGWAMCNGQLLPINQNQALFSLLGTVYGGDGRVSFGLPNLQGRVPIHTGRGHTLGEQGGEQSHTLSMAELPAHTHTATAASVAGTTPVPISAFLGVVPQPLYGPADSNLGALNPATLSNIGGSQAHLNLQPFLALNFCIALQGIFPSQN